jgi:3-phenylpropionate/trans-cinnamate dioxygenase ferredoxin reductase subunit
MTGTDSDTAIVVGGGQAGAQCAISLRQHGWTGAIVMIAAEETLPYQRPPLSKAYLAGEMTADRLLLRDRTFYDAQNIQMRLGESVTAIDRRDNVVVTSEGEVFPFAKLFLATGTRPRKLAVPGIHLDGIGYLRGIADVRRLQPAFQSASNLAVIGGGYIGLEVAAIARKRGMNVTVVEAGERLLGRVTGEFVSDFFAEMHHAKGVDIRLRTTIAAFEGERGVRAMRLSSGEELPCDLAVIGIGVDANDELAMYSGIDVEPGVGIVVDPAMRTSDLNIYAIGDCALANNPFAGRRQRIESVANAIEQGRIAAAHAAGVTVPVPAVPWFWSDQYDVKLQSAGLLSKGYDQTVVRGDPSSGRFSVFYLQGRALVALDAINAAADFNVAKRIIAMPDVALDAAGIADLGRDVRELLPA